MGMPGRLALAPSYLSGESFAGGSFPRMKSYRLAFAARRLRMRRLIISTPAEKAREK
jgi:hypothetical protein